MKPEACGGDMTPIINEILSKRFACVLKKSTSRKRYRIDVVVLGKYFLKINIS